MKIDFDPDKLEAAEFGGKARNAEEAASLKKLGDGISRLIHETHPASEDFTLRLKARLTEARTKKPSFMQSLRNSVEALIQSLTAKRLSFAVALFVLVAFVSVTVLQSGLPFGTGEGPGAAFSRLIISPAYAQDNFQLLADDKDSLGVAGNTSFTLVSKEPVDTDRVRDNLAIEPKVEMTIRATSATSWKIEPKAPFAPNTIIKISLATASLDAAGQVQARDFNWAYQVTDSFKVLSSIPRDTGTGVPLDSGIEVTFSHDNFKDFEKFFSLTPAAAGRFEKHGRTAVFVPTAPLQAGTIYTAKVAKGLPLDGSDETLGADYAFAFETRTLVRQQAAKAWLQTSRTLYDFKNGDAPAIQLSASNIPENKVQIEVYALGGADAFLAALRRRDRLPAWSYAKDDYSQDVSGLQKVLSFNATLEKRSHVDYVQFPTPLAKGYYVVNFLGGDAKDQAWVQVSDVSSYVQVTETQTIVWVNSMATAGPVSGAGVELADRNLRFRTDEKGTAVFATPEALLNVGTLARDSRREYFKITTDNDAVIAPASRLTRGGEEYYGEWYGNSAEAYWRYLYADRPLYQPTDTIRLWGLLKDRRSGKAATEKAKVALYKEGYTDYYYNPVRVMEKDVTLDEFGTFTSSLEYANLKPDYYTLQLIVGEDVVVSQYLSIRPYTKPAYTLEMIPEKKAAFIDEAVKVSVKAGFFEGTPVPGVALNVGGSADRGRLTTGEDGTAAFTVPSREGGARGNYGWPTYEWLSLTPAESELGDIQADANIRYFWPRVYSRVSVEYPEKGKARATVKVRKVDLSQIDDAAFWDETAFGKEPAPGAKVTGTVIRTTYIEEQKGTGYDFINKRTYPIINYRQVRENVDQISGTTDANGLYVYERQVEPKTSYELRLTISDDAGRYEQSYAYFSYYNGEYYETYRNTGDYEYYHLGLPEKSRFKIGQEVEARFLKNDVQLPSAAKPQYLYMQLQRGLQEFAVSASSAYRFPFEERDIPNIHLTAVYFTGSTYAVAQTSRWFFDSASIQVDLEDRDLAISAATDKPRYVPGEDVTLAVEVKDRKGNPVAASVNFNLIDEAYYAVVQDTADPLASIYAPVGPGTVFSGYTHRPSLAQYSGAEGGGCFAAGTIIAMADGSVKPIEKVAVGDEVLTFADPISLEKVSGKVTETFQHLVKDLIVINGALTTTPEHRLFVSGNFRMADEIKVGDWLLSKEGRKVPVTKVERRAKIAPVFNFAVAPQHTYFAGGFYVHNDKGDGVRQNFTDAALFRTIATGADGKGTVKFTLPDNITSWRVTTQAIGADLKAGANVSKIPVSLPVFADVTVGQEYLAGETVKVKMRAYGTALKQNDPVKFAVEAQSLGLAKSPEQNGSAFASVRYALPTLVGGSHDVTYRLTTAKGNDAVKLPISVVGSRLEHNAVIMDEVLSTATRLPAAAVTATVVLSDKGQNQLYRPLQQLAWSFGDRVDQAMSRHDARTFLNDVYGENVLAAPFEGYRFQTGNGGIALLPYSSSEIGLSAKAAAVGAEHFDRAALRSYFFRILENRGSTPEEVSLSLYGLASLGEPVLTRLNAWRERTDLSIKERLYLGLAAHELGADELARALYKGVLEEKGETKNPWHLIRDGKTDDETLEATALAGTLASALEAPERDGFRNYLRDNKGKLQDILLNFTELAYIKETMPKLKPSPAKVKYAIAGNERQVELTGGRSKSFQFEPAQRDAVRFLEVTGDVGVSVRVAQPAAESDLGKHADVGIRREYYVNGARTATFKDGDTVEVRLYPTISPGASQDRFQIADLLPSGLLPTTMLHEYGVSFGAYGACGWYPYAIEGQRVRFNLGRDQWNKRKCQNNYIAYRARVKTAGIYKAEPAIIQGYLVPEVANHTPTETVTIE